MDRSNPTRMVPQTHVCGAHCLGTCDLSGRRLTTRALPLRGWKQLLCELRAVARTSRLCRMIHACGRSVFAAAVTAAVVFDGDVVAVDQLPDGLEDRCVRGRVWKHRQ